MRHEAGSALFATIVATVVFVGLTVAMITISLASKRDNDASLAWSQRRYLAEAGISDAVLELTARNSGAVASAGSPRVFGTGAYFVTSTDNGDDSFTVRSRGTVGSGARVLEAIVRVAPSGAFRNSLYAGNSSGDGTYTLEFGGTGGNADTISGDIYSGGDISFTGDASASGTPRASGTISGGPGEEGVTIPIPDIAGMDYATNNDVDVAAEFAAHGTSAASGSLGGTALQVPESNLAHIFRKNPDDRSTENLGTSKDDYYLEDPYEPVLTANTTDPTAATPLSLAGVNGEPGSSGNGKVYYIDGNLWLHNRPFYALAMLGGDPGGVQVTFVVSGNIYLCDNLLLSDSATDAIALIAVKDAAVSDSGNIYFGDPAGGTLEQMDAFMYAENDFYDTNLDASGSLHVEVNGTMSAGNQIAIDRDVDGVHTQLVMNFDDRVETGAISLPGLPSASGATGPRTMEVVSVYEVGAD